MVGGAVQVYQQGTATADGFSQRLLLHRGMESIEADPDSAAIGPLNVASRLSNRVDQVGLVAVQGFESQYYATPATVRCNLSDAISAALPAG